MASGGDLVPWGSDQPQTRAERLTEQFYAWEKRGRGWQLWEVPVELEPPFRPFLFHTEPPRVLLDDGRKPTLFTAFIDRLSGRSSSAEVIPAESDFETDVTEPEPDVCYDDDALTEIQIALPPTLKIGGAAAEQFLSAVRHVSRPLSFEIVGLPGSIVVQLACRDGDCSQTRQQLRAYFPEAVLSEQSGFLKQQWDVKNPESGVVVEFGLSHEFMRPLRVCTGFDPDPLIGIVAAMSELDANEASVFQILFQAARPSWGESIVRSVLDHEGRGFFVDAPEMVTLARQKAAAPLCAVVIRVAAQSSRYGRAWEIAKSIASGLAQFSDPLSNELIPLTNDAYDAVEHVNDLLLRRTHRSGMLLNARELLSFVHLPSTSVRTDQLKREEKRTKAVPGIALGHALVLGENVHAGRKAVVTLSPEHRIRHTYLVGASGTGKSTLLLNLVIQDIRQGDGVAVFDPHGDLIDQILGHIPESRFSDVLLLDPSDEEYAVGFNILSAHSELEKNLLASDLVAVFRRLSTSWGDQMTSVLGNAILAFLESERGGTLLDLRRFLVEPDFRNGFLPTVKDQEVVYFWRKEFPLLTGKPQAPLLTRLDTFLRPKLIRHMVAQKENRIDFRNLLNNGGIFLAKLAQGAIGEENSYLLGSLLVSKFHQLAMSRQDVSESERRNFYLYIDEFHNFVTPSMASILSGARKYHLGLTLAHQDLRQLLSRDMELASAVISNPCTRICFRVGDQDAQKLADGFSFFGSKDLQNLGIAEAIGRIERAEYDFNLKTLPLSTVDSATAQERRVQLVALSRTKYARKRTEVEAELAQARPAEVFPQPSEKLKAERKVSDAIPQMPTPEKPVPSRLPVPEPIEAETAGQDFKLPPPLLAGRGGAQHKYLQQLIKRWGEDKGYRATIEKQILGGAGSVDVALEKDDRTIACEISVTTSVEHEAGNVQKCLAAGFSHVAVVATDKKTLTNLKQAVVGALGPGEVERVGFFTPEELLSFLEELAAQGASKEETVRGYRVKAKYKPVSESEQKAKKQAIAQTILQALKRLKGK